MIELDLQSINITIANAKMNDLRNEKNRSGVPKQILKCQSVQQQKRTNITNNFMNELNTMTTQEGGDYRCRNALQNSITLIKIFYTVSESFENFIKKIRQRIIPFLFFKTNKLQTLINQNASYFIKNFWTQSVVGWSVYVSDYCGHYFCLLDGDCVHCLHCNSTQWWWVDCYLFCRIVLWLFLCCSFVTSVVVCCLSMLMNFFDQIRFFFFSRLRKSRFRFRLFDYLIDFSALWMLWFEVIWIFSRCLRVIVLIFVVIKYCVWNFSIKPY